MQWIWRRGVRVSTVNGRDTRALRRVIRHLIREAAASSARGVRQDEARRRRPTVAQRIDSFRRDLERVKDGAQYLPAGPVTQRHVRDWDWYVKRLRRQDPQLADEAEELRDAFRAAWEAGERRWSSGI